MRRGEGGHRVIVAGPRTDRGWDRLSISVLFRPNAIGYRTCTKMKRQHQSYDGIYFLCYYQIKEAIIQKIKSSFPNAKIVQTYACTEAALSIAFQLLDGPAACWFQFAPLTDTTSYTIIEVFHNSRLCQYFQLEWSF